MNLDKSPLNKVDKALLILVALNLASKLALLNWNLAEYTDSVYYLTIGQIGKSKWLPVFPVLVQFFHLFVPDLTYSGRLASIVMSTLSIFPLYAIAKRVYSRRAAIYTAIIYLVSPIITRWSIKIMTESTFAFLLLMAIWFFMKWHDRRKSVYAMGAVGCSGIAALSRPEGIGLLPLALVFVAYLLWKYKFRISHWIFLGLIPWLFQIFWHLKVVGRYGYGAELQGGAKKLTIGKFFSYFGLYSAYLPYIMTPIIFAFAVYGIVMTIRSTNKMGKIYSILSLCIFVIWLIGLSIHWAWTTRFLYPIVVLAIVFFGYGISCLKNAFSRKLALSASVLLCLVFTVILLISSRATFGDIRQAAYYIRDEVPTESRVLSTETIKTKFWSGRSIEKYKRSNIKSGSYVALQNIYCDYEQEMEYLNQKYDIRRLYHKRLTTIPVFCDDMYMIPVKRKDGTFGQRGTANHPITPRTQFSKQRIESAVIFIQNEKI